MKKKEKTMEVGGERSGSHRSGISGGGSEFFICFTSRPSSSSATSCSAAMRVPSSKALMSPGRNRDPSAPSLSASLSRRLRSSGSVKGGQSPMFPAATGAVGSGGRKKGCAFEAAEPSSPKVTCIGQVRVKSKKKKKGSHVVVRSRSQRGGEASFRRTAADGGGGERECLPNRNQRWVHQLPISICESLRGLGSEFNCFLPCGGGGRSGCSSSSSSSSLRGGEEKRSGGEKRSSTSSSCGAVFARWLMAIQESEGKTEEVVGLVVEERGKGEVGLLVRERTEERDEVDLPAEEVGGKIGGAERREEVAMVEKEEEEEEGRVSVCIPPRNALLLMRCRSDPVKMAALANRFWGSPAAKGPCQVEEEVDQAEDDEHVGNGESGNVGKQGSEEDEQSHPEVEKEGEEKAGEEVEAASEVEKQELDNEKSPEAEEIPAEAAEEMEKQEEGFQAESLPLHTDLEKDVAEAEETMLQEEPEEEELKEETQYMAREEVKEEIKGRRSISCASAKSNVERRSQNSCFSKAKEGGRRRSCSSKDKERRRHSFSTEWEARRLSFSSGREARRASFSTDREGRRRSWSFSVDKEEMVPNDKAQAEKKTEETSVGEEAKETVEAAEESQVMAEEEMEEEVVEAEIEKSEGEGEKRRELPDCLLLMMYEPKLSMEVSKETWVCSTDFLRWRPPYSRRPTGGSGEGISNKGTAKAEGGDNKVVAAPAPRPPPTVSAIEQKLLSSAVGPRPPPAAPPYEPFVLTRCKSEPMKRSSRLAPEACFWKSRHQPIGATGIGF